MARNTTNLLLKVWDGLMDRFSHVDLASNWDTIDAHDHTGGTKGLRITNGALADGAVDARTIAGNLKASGTATSTTEALRSLGTGVGQALPGNATITLAQLEAIVQQALNPTGALIAYGGATAPTGWLVCDGAPVSRTTYATLFAAIGTAWGIGDGTSTFNLPDLRGRTLVGATAAVNAGAPALAAGLSARLLAAKLGTELETAPLPSHSHTLSSSGTGVTINGAGTGISASTDTNVLSVSGTGTAFDAGGTGNSGATGFSHMWHASYGVGISDPGHGHGITDPGHGHTVNSTGSGGTHNNIQPSAVGNWIIKT